MECPDYLNNKFQLSEKELEAAFIPVKSSFRRPPDFIHCMQKNMFATMDLFPQISTTLVFDIADSVK